MEVWRGRVECLVDGESDGTSVPAEGGAGVVEVPFPVAITDVRGPGVSPIARHSVFGPLWNLFSVEDGFFLTPCLKVGRRHHADTYTGREDVVAAVFPYGKDWIVNIGIVGVELRAGWPLFTVASGKEGYEECQEDVFVSHGM